MMRLAPVVALALAWSGTASAYELARPMGLYPAGNGAALAMLDSRIDVTVRGPIVEVVVVQRFRNAAEHATEATYIFPLPDDAAVSAMAIQVGTRTIRGAIETRDAAQRRYEAAVAAGVAGALLEQERPDVFTQSVAAIPAHGVVEVTLRYDTLAHYQAGSWELVLPMVVAPRYVPGTASGRATTGSGRAPDTERAPDASRVTPAGAPGAGGSTAIAIHFVDAPSELVSPTHEIAATRSDATLSDPHSDHDAIIRWRSPAPSAGWVERDGDGGFAAIVVEAAAASPAAHKPLRVILAIDRAATTRGDGDAVERPLVRALCGGLDAADRVRVIGSDAFAWNAPGDVLRALERVWATSVPVFDLTRVLAGAHPEGAAIILVSDGLVADDRAAIAAARRLGVPIHVLGIGPAPARATLHQLAAVTGGTERYAVAGDDMIELARAVLGDIATPPAPLTINWGTLGALDVEPAVLPRLGAGQAMLVLARVKRAQAANARTRGELFAFAPLGPPRTIDGATTSHGPLARRWARERLDDLVASRRDRATVVNHAVAYGLVSPYTSLVAIGSDVVVSGGVKRSVAVPVSIPSGMHWQAVKQLLERDAGSDAVLDTVRPRAQPVPPSPETITPTGRAPASPAPMPTAEPEPAPPPATTTPPAKHRPGAGDTTGARTSSKKAGKADADRPARKPGAADKRRDLADAEKRRERAGDDGSPSAGEATVDAKLPSKKGFTPAEPAPHEDRAKEVSSATAPAPLSDEELTKLAEAENKSEAITVTGSLIGRAPQHLRGISLSAALGGGVAVDHGAHSLLSLDVRLDLGGATRLGGEAALWLVGGAHPQGRGLLTVSTDRLRWLDLSLGAGLHVGDGTGVAGALRLRIGTPLRWLGVYGRYDAALLLTRPSVELEHAASLGLQLSY